MLNGFIIPYFHICLSSTKGTCIRLIYCSTFFSLNIKYQQSSVLERGQTKITFCFVGILSKRNIRFYIGIISYIKYRLQQIDMDVTNIKLAEHLN